MFYDHLQKLILEGSRACIVYVYDPMKSQETCELLDWGQLVGKYKNAKAAKKAIKDGWVVKRKTNRPATGKRVTAYAVYGAKGSYK